MPGLLLPSQIGSRVRPPFGSSPVEDDELFGDVGADTSFQPQPDLEFTPSEEDGAAWQEPSPLKPVDGVNPLSTDPREADRISRDPRFRTPLTPEEEPAFQEWKQKNFPEDSGYDYDLQGAFKAGMTPDPATGHGLDTYKLPNHPTFSDQSQYAQIMPEAAGGWDENDNYVPAKQWQQRTGIEYTPAEQQPTLTTGQSDEPEAPSYNLGFQLGLGFIQGAGSLSEMVGSLLEAYGDETLIQPLGEKARAAGKTVGDFALGIMGPEWADSAQKSWLDLSENGALRDPRAYMLALSQQLAPLYGALKIAKGAGAALKFFGAGEKVATSGGWAVAGAVSSAGDAASSAADAADEAGLDDEQRQHMERVASKLGAAAGAITGPILGKVFKGAAGNLGANVALGVGEQVVEEGATESAAQYAKTTEGLPFDWRAVAEAAVQGAVVGGPVGAYGAMGEHARKQAVAAQEAEQTASTDAEQAAIKSEVDRINAAKVQAEQDKQAAEAATAYVPGAAPPVAGDGGFVAGMDPSVRSSPEAQDLGLRQQIGERMFMLGHQMVVIEDMVQRETDPEKKKQLTEQFQAGRKQLSALKAEYALYPAPPVPQNYPQPAQAAPLQLTGPTPAPTAAEPSLEHAQALSAIYGQLTHLQAQIVQTKQPEARAVLVEQFRQLNKQADILHAQALQGASPQLDDTVVQQQAAAQNPNLLRLPGPTADEMMGVETLPSGKLPPVAAVSTPEGRAASIRAAQQARLDVAAAKQVQTASAQIDKLTPQVQDLETKLGRLQGQIAEQRHAPTRAKMVGQFIRLRGTHQDLSAELDAAKTKRDRDTGKVGPRQMAIPGLEEVPQTGLNQGREPDYAVLARDLDRMMPGVGVDAAPVSVQDGTAPLEIGPIAEIFDKWVKKSQAAKAGHQTRQAKKLQAARDAGTQPDPAAPGEPAPSHSDQPVRVDGTPNEQPAPEPAPLPDLPAETGHTASAGAELAAIRTHMPSRRAPPSEPSPAAQAAPQVAAVSSRAPKAPLQPTPAVRAPQALPGPTPDPVEAEAAKRNQPLTQGQFVEIATKLNETKAKVEAQMPPPIEPKTPEELFVVAGLGVPNMQPAVLARAYTRQFGGTMAEALNYINALRRGTPATAPGQPAQAPAPPGKGRKGVPAGWRREGPELVHDRGSVIKRGKSFLATSNTGVIGEFPTLKEGMDAVLGTADAVLQKVGAKRITQREFFQEITTGEYQNAGLIGEDGTFWMLPRGYGHGGFRDEAGNQHSYVEISTAGTDSAGAGRPDKRPWTPMQRQRVAGLEADFKRLNGGVPSPYGTYIVIDDNTSEEVLADPASPLYKVPEDGDPPSTGVLEAALQLETRDPAQVDIAARSPRNVLARLLADGPVRVDTAIAHLRANMLVPKGSNLDLLMQRLAGAFPATANNPTGVMVENISLSNGFQGLYDPKADRIYIDLQQAENPLHAVLHEMVHAAVIVRMGQLNFQEEMTKFAQTAKQLWVENGFQPRYNELIGFRSTSEFLSEALTNSWFQENLAHLFNKEYPNELSTWGKLKSKLATRLGFAPKSPERDLFNNLLEFLPDSDFLKENPNREHILAELDRLGLSQANALFSLSAAILRVRPSPVLSAVPPKGRVAENLIRVMLGNQLAESYGKLGQSFLDGNGLVQPLQDTINWFFRLQNARNGYAKEQLNKSSKIVEVFKNAATDDVAGVLGDVMVKSRMYGLDASKPFNDPANLVGGKRPGAAEAYNDLQNLWRTLTSGQRDTYELVRDHGDEIRYGQMSDLMVQRMRSLVGETEADDLLNYIASRGKIASAVGARPEYNIDLGYHPILTAQEIDTQVALLVPPAKQDTVAKALKEVHTLLKHTVGPYFPLRRYGNYFTSFKSNPQSRVMTQADLDAMVADDRRNGNGTLMIDSMKPAGPTQLMVEWHHEQFETSDSEQEAYQRHDEIKRQWDDRSLLDGRVFTSKAMIQREQAYDSEGFRDASIDSLRDELKAALGPGLGQLAADQALQWFLEKSPATSVNKSRMGARLVSGASTDILRAYAEYAQGTAYQRAQIKYGPQMRRVLGVELPADAAKMEANGARDQASDLQKIGTELQRRAKFQVDRMVAERNHGNWMKLWQQAPQLAYVWLLTGTGTMVVNGMQPIQITLPYLGARYGFVAASAAMASVYKDIAWRGTKETFREGKRAFKGLPGAFAAAKAGRATPSIRNPRQSLAEHMVENLPQGEKDLVTELARLGKVDYGMVADIQAAVRARGKTANLPGVANKAQAAIDKGLNLVSYVNEAAFIGPQAIETTNRVVTGLMEFRLMKARLGIPANAVVDPATGLIAGHKFSDMVSQIATSIDTTQVNYERDNKPPVMQHEAYKSALVFKHYAVQQWYNITHNFMQSFKGDTPEERRQARAFLGGWTATTMLMTGAAGIMAFEPIYLAACALMLAFGDDEDKDPEEALRRWMGEWNDTVAGQILRKGVPYYAGVDMSRMGLSQLFPAEEAWGLYRDPSTGSDDVYSFMGKLFGGAPLSMVIENWGRGSYNMWQGNFSKGIEQVAPKAFMLNDGVRAYNYSQTGMTSRTGQERLGPEEISLTDKIIRVLGFAPSALSETAAKQFGGNYATRVIKAKKYDLIDEYAKAAVERKSVTAIIQKIVQFNRQNPGDAMTKASLLGAVKRRVTENYRLRTEGVKATSKGAILRARESASRYQTPDQQKQQFADDAAFENTDPSMMGIVANTETMRNLNLQLGKSGKQSGNILDIRAETKAIANIDSMSEAADRLRQFGVDDKTVEFNVSEARRRTLGNPLGKQEKAAVEVMKDILLDELNLARGVDAFDKSPMYPERWNDQFGANLAPAEDHGDRVPSLREEILAKLNPPVPKSKPRSASR